MNSVITEKLKKLPKHQMLWILKLENHILTNLDSKDMNISRIANDFGLSERQFYRKVKTIIQMTPNNLIRLIKLEMAKKYLEQGEYATVSEVSHAVGYCRSDYFSDIFYNYFGKRPIDYKFMN